MSIRVSILAAGILSMAVSGASAASLVLTYTDVQVADNATFTSNLTNVTPSAGNVIVVAPGQYFRFGLRATVAGNPNSAGAIATGVALGVPQPANLGVLAFGATITNSLPGGVVPRVSTGTDSTTIVNPLFVSISEPGVVDSATGNIGTGQPANQIIGGVNAGAVPTNDPAALPRLSIGASAVPAENTLFNRTAYQFTGTGQVSLTPSIPGFPGNGLAFVVPSSPGEVSPGNEIYPTYGRRDYDPAVDTLVGPGALVIVPEPASMAVVGLGGAALLVRRRKA